MECDASMHGLGGVLLQKDESGDWKPCDFYSRSLREYERNYSINVEKALAMVEGLKKWRHWLLNHPEKILVRTDHKNLTSLLKLRVHNARMVRWLDYIQ